MIRRTTRLCAILATILALTLSPARVPGTIAQDATQEPEGGAESELAPQLPPVDLPTMNERAYVFELDSVWDGNASTPQELPIYEYEAMTYTEEQVSEIASALGIEGEIEAQGDGTYSVAGNGSLFTTPGLLQYVSGEQAPDEEIPDDVAAVAFARDWLRVSGLLPANANDGAVIATIDTPARKIVEFKPASPAPLLSSTPGITVTIGPGGTILETRISWATINQGDVYQLRSVDDAFNDVASRLSYLDVTLPEDQFPQGSTITGTVTYHEVAIAYATSGVQGDLQYMQPVYVFSGTYTPEGGDGTYDIVAYVPAIVTSLQPVG